MRPEPVSSESETRSRILAVAERLFAEQGFAATSIRDLAKEAEVNVAAINYHFNSKDNLYLETLRFTFRRSRETLPLYIKLLDEARKTGTTEAALKAIRQYVDQFLRALLEQSESARHTCLMSREISDPSPALDVVIDEFVAPKVRILEELVLLARPDLKGTMDAHLHTLSIVGQCLHYPLTLPVTLRLLKRKKLGPELVTQISQHIADTTMKALAKE